MSEGPWPKRAIVEYDLRQSDPQLFYNIVHLFLTEEGVQPQGHKRGINLGCGVGCRPEMMGRFPKSESRALSMDKVTEVVRCRLYSEDSKQNLVTYDSLFKKAENMCMSESKRNCILKKLPWSRGLSSLSFLNTLP